VDLDAVEDLFTHLELVELSLLLTFKECFLAIFDLTVVFLDLLDALGICSLGILDVQPCSHCNRLGFTVLQVTLVEYELTSVLQLVLLYRCVVCIVPPLFREHVFSDVLTSLPDVAVITA